MRILINLFPQNKKTASERMVYFGLHYLKHILVITQFVSICVFFYRFRVDQEIVDLKEKLSQKDSIVVATSSLIEAVDTLDFKLKNIKEVVDSQRLLNNNLETITSQIPENIVVESLNVNTKNVELSGNSQAAQNIRDFYEKLIESSKYEKVTLTGITRTGESFEFNLIMEGFK